jgi:hypothetical protein
MKIKILINALIIGSMVFFSCRNSDTSVRQGDNDQSCLTTVQKEILKEDSLLNELFDDTSEFYQSVGFAAAPANRSNYGTIVDYEDVKPCLDFYKTTMAQYGIDERDPTGIDLRVLTSLKITWAEIFRGRELKKFIKNAAALHRTLFRNNKNLEIQVRLGRYTHDFAAEYDPTREGRLCVFLVTKLYRDISTDSTKRVWVEDGFDKKSFNFGGMEP